LTRNKVLQDGAQEKANCMLGDTTAMKNWKCFVDMKDRNNNKFLIAVTPNDLMLQHKMNCCQAAAQIGRQEQLGHSFLNELISIA